MKNWISTVHTMLNVVFIMLIFFIVTVSFIKKTWDWDQQVRK